MEIAISVIEAAKRLSLGRSSIYKAIGRGDITPRKIGGRTLILVSELEAWIKRAPTAETHASVEQSNVRSRDGDE